MDGGLRDRSTGLVIAGIVEILIGAVLFLLVPLSLLGGSIEGQDAVKPDPRSIVVSACVYLVLAIFFVWTGVDTVRRRRWARTLMHSVAGLWLIVGIAVFLFWLVMSPRLESLLASSGAPSLTSGALAIVKLFVSILLLVVYVAMPAAFLLFLRGPSVRATVERHDPTVPWTDRVAGPVLSMILTLVYLAATGVMLAPFGGAPFFGILLGPIASAVAWLALAALCGWLAHRFYRGDRRACSGTIALTVLGTVSAVWTFLRVDAMELWLAMGIQEAQRELLRDSWIGSATAMIWMSVLSGAALIGYTVHVRRHMPLGRR